MTAGRCCAAAGSVLPGAALALVPKCPLCLAAWLAASGIGISAAAASELRLALIGLCLAASLYCGVRSLRRGRQLFVHHRGGLQLAGIEVQRIARNGPDGHVA